MANKCWLTGNLTKDVEYQKTASGIDVARFTIAVNRKFKNDKGETEIAFDLQANYGIDTQDEAPITIEYITAQV